MGFLLENGNGVYSVGFGSQSLQVYVFMHDAIHRMVCDLNGNRIRAEETTINAKLNAKYMICINTYENTLFSKTEINTDIKIMSQYQPKN